MDKPRYDRHGVQDHSMNHGEGARAAAGERRVKAAFAAMALASVLAGLAIYLLRGPLGIAEDTARLVSTAFILAAVADALVLYFWNRLFKRPR